MKRGEGFSSDSLKRLLCRDCMKRFGWSGGGIPNEDGSVDDDDYSIAASDEDFDDGEDLFLRAQKSLSSEPQTPRQGPEVIVFQDPSKASSNDPDCDTTSFEKKSFMASMLQKQNRSAAPSGGSTTKRKRRLNQEDEEETKLEHLDRSLSNLVSHLSAPKKTSVSLDTILSSTLPPPTKGKNPQRHPRRIKEGMARVQLERSLAADKEALVSGTVRAKNSRTLTKRQKRAQDGTTERVRRARKALADRGSIGKTVGGGMIKLSSREIKMGMNGSKSRGKGFVGKG